MILVDKPRGFHRCYTIFQTRCNSNNPLTQTDVLRHQTPHGVLQISSNKDDPMGVQIKTPQKSLDQILTPQKIPCRISEAKFGFNFRRTTRSRIFRLF